MEACLFTALRTYGNSALLTIRGQHVDLDVDSAARCGIIICSLFHPPNDDRGRRTAAGHRIRLPQGR